MTIRIGAAIGEGPTELAAFDAALQAAGAADYNLIRLSSIIPPHAGLVLAPPETPLSLGGDWGDRLYAVWAEQSAHEPGQEAWAGLGWMRDPDSGRGFFVEHWGTTEHHVRQLISQSLRALATTRGMAKTRHEMRLVGATCSSRPVCALVIAAYAVRSWVDSGSTVAPPRRQTSLHEAGVPIST